MVDTLIPWPLHFLPSRMHGVERLHLRHLRLLRQFDSTPLRITRVYQRAMKKTKDSDDPPSYVESVRSHGTPLRASTEHYGGTDLVHSLLTDDIIPHIQTAIASGIISTTFVLIPSNASSLRPPADSNSKAVSKGFSGEQLVGFPGTEELKLIRLLHPEDTCEFWQRLGSRQSLADSLHAYLVQEGYYFPEDIAKAQPFEMLTGVPSNARAGWMTANEERLRHLEASINVMKQEVCLRIEDEMGLYGTRKGNALVVRVRLGCKNPP